MDKLLFSIPFIKDSFTHQWLQDHPNDAFASRCYVPYPEYEDDLLMTEYSKAKCIERSAFNINDDFEVLTLVIQSCILKSQSQSSSSIIFLFRSYR